MNSRLHTDPAEIKSFNG